MRLRIERAQEGDALSCRKQNALIVYVLAVAAVVMLVEISEVGLTQSEHFLVVKL
jgi:hypothetical protein